MLVRLPLLTSHKWRELVPSGRLVCRYHYVFLWYYVCFVLLRFRLHVFVEAAGLRVIALRYAGAPIATRVYFSFFGDNAFSEYFLYHFRFLFVYREYVVRSFFRMVFFYLVTTAWIFDISLYENSINKSIIEGPPRRTASSSNIIQIHIHSPCPQDCYLEILMAIS